MHARFIADADETDLRLRWLICVATVVSDGAAMLVSRMTPRVGSVSMQAFAVPLSYPLRVLLRQRLLSPFWPDSFPDEIVRNPGRPDLDSRTGHYRSALRPGRRWAA